MVRESSVSQPFPTMAPFQPVSFLWPTQTVLPRRRPWSPLPSPFTQFPPVNPRRHTGLEHCALSPNFRGTLKKVNTVWGLHFNPISSVLSHNYSGSRLNWIPSTNQGFTMVCKHAYFHWKRQNIWNHSTWNSWGNKKGCRHVQGNTITLI